MTDPIGTAQERELIEWLRCPRFYGTMNEEGRAALYAMAATMEKAADALQSRIAEVGRLEERVGEIEKAFYDRLKIYRTKRDEAKPFAEDSMNRHDAFALVVEAFEYLEHDAALSLQRRV